LGHDIGFGIGIAHGFATLGTIGSMPLSGLYPTSHPEAKPGQVLISPRVLMAVEDAIIVEQVGEFVLKGIRRPIAAVSVLTLFSDKIISRMVAIRQPTTEFIGSAIV
jgi:adenylate cyclase